MILEKAILHIYPDAVPSKDFFIIEDENGLGIRHWKYPSPIPTEEQLQAAWEQVQNEPRELSPIEKLEEQQKNIQKALDDIILGGGLL